MAKTVIINLLSVPTRNSQEVEFVSTLRPLNVGGKIARTLMRRISPLTIRLFEDYTVLDKALAEAETVVMCDYKGMVPLARHIDRVAAHCRRIAWFWNSLSHTGIPSLPPHWELWTFDPADAARTGMHYGGQFYFPEVCVGLSSPAAISTDVCFIGRDKGRFRLLNRLEEKLHAAGLTTFFHRVGPWPGQKKTIPYIYYLGALQSSYAALEILADGQTGLSLRTLEALLLGRKLLTTNTAITTWRYYDTSRILVVNDQTPPEAFRAFLSTDGGPVDLSYFTFDAWLLRLLAGIEATDFPSITGRK